MIYQSWLESWLLSKKKKIKPSSFASYSLLANKHLIPRLGSYEISEITEDVLQDAIIFWAKEGKCRTREPLSRKTIKELIGIARQSFSAYHKEFSLAIPSFDELAIPTNFKKTPEVFTNTEQEKIIKDIFIDISNKKVGIALGLLIGMRIGEVCALKWDDIDLENRRINISKTLQRVYSSNFEAKGNSELLLGSTKSEDSTRVVPISSTLYNILKIVKPEETTLLYILSGTKKPIEPGRMRSFYYRFLKKINVRQLPFHSLRHTFGTKAITCKTDVATVCKIMGHSSPSTTLNLYCHPQFEDMKRAVDDLDTKWI